MLVGGDVVRLGRSDEAAGGDRVAVDLDGAEGRVGGHGEGQARVRRAGEPVGGVVTITLAEVGRRADGSGFGPIDVAGTVLPGFGDFDALMTKFDCAGELLWADLVGATGKDRAFTVAVAAGGESLFGGECHDAFPGQEAGSACAMFVERRAP